MNDLDRDHLLDVLDQLPRDDAAWLVRLVIRGERARRALLVAAKDYNRLRKRLRRPAPRVSMN